MLKLGSSTCNVHSWAVLLFYEKPTPSYTYDTYLHGVAWFNFLNLIYMVKELIILLGITNLSGMFCPVPVIHICVEFQWIPSFWLLTSESGRTGRTKRQTDNLKKGYTSAHSQGLKATYSFKILCQILTEDNASMAHL